MNAKSVLIAGAGVAGPTLAYWLKAAGFEPTLVEVAPALREGGYVIDFWGLGYDIAERMGLTNGLDRAGYHIRELRIVDAHGARVGGFGARVIGALSGKRFVTIARSDLSRALFEKIRGATETIFGDDILGLEDRDAFVQVQLKKSGERRFDLAIGADGLHSNVRRLAFGPQDLYEKPLGYWVAAFEARGYRPRDEDVYVIYSEPGRMLGRFALRNDRTLFLFVFADETPAFPAADLAAEKGALHAKFDAGMWECPRILAELDDTQALYFDRVSQIKMKSWSRGRVALVGDASCCVSLLAGQGSALAMTAAYVLAGELAKAAGRHQEAFGRYEALLRDYIAAKQQGAERFGAAFAPKTEWGLFLRNQVTKALAIPGLARLTFGRDIADSLRLPDYDWPAVDAASRHDDGAAR